MEKAILDIKELDIIQGMNGSYSHNGDKAIDLGKACSYLRAPFTGTIKRIYKNSNAVWLESSEKVMYADGTVDYMTVMTLHDNNISNLKVGQKIYQGETYYHPGVKGNVTGSHIHIAVGKGKFRGNGWYKGKYQPKAKSYAWLIYNQYDVNKALFIADKVKQTNTLYKWKLAGDDINKVDNSTDKQSYYSKCLYKGSSIVGGLKSIKVDSSFINRKKIAKKNNIDDYRGTAEQNTKLLNLLKKGKLKK